MVATTALVWCVSVDIWYLIWPNKPGAFSWSLILHICLPLINGELHDLRWQSCTLQSFDGRHQWLLINWDSCRGLHFAGRDNFVRLLGNMDSCSILLAGVKVDIFVRTDSTYPWTKTWVFWCVLALPGGGTSACWDPQLLTKAGLFPWRPPTVCWCWCPHGESIREQLSHQWQAAGGVHKWQVQKLLLMRNFGCWQQASWDCTSSEIVGVKPTGRQKTTYKRALVLG